MGKCYAAHSTAPVCRKWLKIYNESLKLAFRANYNDKVVSDEEDQCEGWVRLSLIELGEISRIELKECKEKINENRFLKDVIGKVIGVNELDNWCKQVAKEDERDWLYPIWSDEVETRPNPRRTEDVIRLVEYYDKEDVWTWVQTVAKVLLEMPKYSTSMDSLMRIVCNADDFDEMKGEILDEFKKRNLSDDLMKVIQEDYSNSEEKMVDAWIKKLSNKKMPDIETLRSSVEKDILVHWKMVQDSEMKGRWRPSRWF